MSPYFRLLRLHQPTGIWLLLWPCWWGIALAARGRGHWPLYLLFALGAVVMRGAGCIVNDMADREMDAKVTRTRTRPLASGELTMRQASGLLAGLLMIAALIACCLQPAALWLAVGSLPLVAAYPFMKRITWWPQAFLGLTFNWGALMGWTAVTGRVDTPTLLLYAGGVCWTLGYDTIYAYQDRADDAGAGVKSTALRLGERGKNWIAGFYALALVAWAGAGFTAEESAGFFLGLLLPAAHFVWQVWAVNLAEPASCMRIFRASRWTGVWVFASILMGR